MVGPGDRAIPGETLGGIHPAITDVRPSFTTARYCFDVFALTKPPQASSSISPTTSSEISSPRLPTPRAAGDYRRADHRGSAQLAIHVRRSRQLARAGVQIDANGPYMTGPTAPYQRKMTVFPISAGFGERHFSFLPPDLDGGMRAISPSVARWFQSPGYTQAPSDSTLESRMGVPVSSCDGILQQDEIIGYFPKDASAWQPKTAPKDIEGVKIRYRNLEITCPRPGRPVDRRPLKFELRDETEFPRRFLHLLRQSTGRVDHYALVTPETNVAGMLAGEPFAATGRMVPGSYGCLFPSLWGSPD